MKIHPQIGPYCHALCAQELERRGLSVGSSVNSALWLENLDSLSTRGHQMNPSRITSNRDIVGQIQAFHSDVPAVPPFLGRDRYFGILKPLPPTVILRAPARGQGNMRRRFYTPIETGLTSPAYMGATCTMSCGFYTAHRT